MQQRPLISMKHANAFTVLRDLRQTAAAMNRAARSINPVKAMLANMLLVRIALKDKKKFLTEIRMTHDALGCVKVILPFRHLVSNNPGIRYPGSAVLPCFLLSTTILTRLGQNLEFPVSAQNY